MPVRKGLFLFVAIVGGGVVGYFAANSDFASVAKVVAATDTIVPAAARTEPAKAAETRSRIDLPAALTAKKAACSSPQGMEQMVAMANLQEQSKPAAPGKKPNILVIMGDDVGIWNIGAYHRGMMAGRTPNLDKLAAAGMLFTELLRRSQLHGGTRKHSLPVNFQNEPG